jgi:hypothetical protein
MTFRLLAECLNQLRFACRMEYILIPLHFIGKSFGPNSSPFQFNLEDGNSIFFRNIGFYRQDYKLVFFAYCEQQSLQVTRWNPKIETSKFEKNIFFFYCGVSW